MNTNNEAIGYLQHNGESWEVIGFCCEDKATSPTRVFHVNIYPYNQSCACCKKTIVEGQSPAWSQLYGS